MPVEFGTEAFPSLDPARANAAYALLAGKSVKEAQKAMVELLRDPARPPRATGRRRSWASRRPIEHAVKFFEKGDRPLEFMTTRQWFVRILEHKEELLQAGDRIAWHPDFMRLRYRNWTENLQLDWCVSRQRYFGVPFPVWYAVKDNGETDFERPILADAKSLPVDPTTDAPPGYAEAQRDQPGRLPRRDRRVRHLVHELAHPADRVGLDRRPGAPRAALPHGPAPAEPRDHPHLGLLHDREGPAARGRDPLAARRHLGLGARPRPQEDVEEQGQRDHAHAPPRPVRRRRRALLVAGRAARHRHRLRREGAEGGAAPRGEALQRLEVRARPGGRPRAPITRELDLGFLARLRETVNRASAAMEAFEYAARPRRERALLLERLHRHLHGDGEGALPRPRDDPEGRGSALATLQLALRMFLRLFAPFLPYVTEEVWSWGFAAGEAAPSVHRAPWPGEADFAALPGLGDGAVFDAAVAFLDAVNAPRAPAGRRWDGTSSSSRATATPAHPRPCFDRGRDDVLAAARVAGHSFEAKPALEEMVFEVAEAELVEPPAAPAPQGLTRWTSASWCGARSTRTGSTAT